MWNSAFGVYILAQFLVKVVKGVYLKEFLAVFGSPNSNLFSVLNMGNPLGEINPYGCSLMVYGELVKSLMPLTYLL